MEHLQIIQYEGSNRHQALIRAADSKKNFVLALQHPQELAEACEILHCSQAPQRLGRWGINALLDALRPEDIAKLLAECDRRPIYLFEQLFLGWNKPPKTAPFIVYCELIGIISDHHDPDRAMQSLVEYIESFQRACLLPLAGIYRFEAGNWVKHRSASDTSRPSP